ncbi:MAG: FadR/GntR family transcriptional regulator [Nocardioidaceae bacterium]
MDGERAQTRGRLRPVRRTSLYEGVLERIREYVETEGLHKGDRLPSERDLADQLGASRATVKQALVVLEVQRLVETRHGGGTFLLRDDVKFDSVSALLARRDRLPHVMDARIALEGKLAELAALRRTEDDVLAMQDALADMAEAVTADRDANPGDKQFHGAVAAAARNPLLSRFLNEIEDEVTESRSESLRQRGRPRQSLRQHQRIADAIRDGNPRAARAAMERHLASVRKVRLLDWQIDAQDDPSNGARRSE